MLTALLGIILLLTFSTCFNIDESIVSPDFTSCPKTYTVLLANFSACCCFFIFINCITKNAIIAPVNNNVNTIPNRNEFLAFLCIGFVAMTNSSLKL